MKNLLQNKQNLLHLILLNNEDVCADEFSRIANAQDWKLSFAKNSTDFKELISEKTHTIFIVSSQKNNIEEIISEINRQNKNFSYAFVLLVDINTNVSEFYNGFEYDEVIFLPLSDEEVVFRIMQLQKRFHRLNKENINDSIVIARNTNLKNNIEKNSIFESRFSTLFENNILGMGIIDANYNVILVNNALLSILEISKEEINTQSINNILKNNFLDLWKYIEESVSRNETSNSFKIDYKITESKIKKIEISFTYIYHPNKEFKETLFVANDYTEEYSNSLNTLELSNITNYSLDAIFRINKKREILSWNNGAEFIFEFTPFEIIGKSLSLIVDETSLNYDFETGKVKSKRKYTIVGKTKSNNKIFLEIFISPISFKNQTIDEYTVLVKDTTSFIQINEELKGYRNAIDKNFILCVWNNKGIITYINENFTKKTKYRKREAVNKPISSFKNTYKCSTIYDEIKSCLLQGKMWCGEVSCFTKDSEEYWCYDTIVPSFSKINKVFQYLLVRIDLTKIKEAEETLNNKQILERSLKLKNDFLSNMSHEIRTPLNSILGFTDLLLESEPTELQSFYLDVVKKSGKLLLNIVNDILDLTKIEEGKVSLKFKPFNLFNLLEDTVSLLKLDADNKGIDLRLIYIQDVESQLIGDENRLQQIISNLLRNAIKFTAKGSVCLTVKQLAVKNYKIKYSFEIADTGIGIDPKKLKVIFDAFTQTEDYLTREHTGLGLGLTIVEKLAKAFGGKITVESELNKGSVFTFTVSLNRNNDQKTKVTKTILKKQIKVLLAEDNENNQILAKTRLESWGFEVDIANNGLEVLEKYKSNHYDVILMDVQMPYLDGYSATQKIRNTFPFEKAKIPIIALTAHSSNGSVEKSKYIGMNDYIYKPFKSKDLYDKIIEVLFSDNRQDNSLTEQPFTCEVDFTYITNECLGNKEIIKIYILSFIKEFEDFIEKCSYYANLLDYHNMYQFSHKILPSVKSFSLKEILELVLVIHDNSKQQVEMQYAHIVVEIANYYSYVKDVLKQKIIQLEK